MFSCNEVHEVSEISRGIRAGNEEHNENLVSTSVIVGHTWSIGLALVNAIVGIAHGEFAMVVTSRKKSNQKEKGKKRSIQRIQKPTTQYTR